MSELKNIYRFGITQRFVDEADAEFILQLRLDEKLSRFLTPTKNDIKSQIEWIKEYKKRESEGKEFYFITVDEKGERFGVNRLYNFDNDSFEVGSWLFKDGTPGSLSILSDLATRDFGFEESGLKTCRFEVRKGNLAVLNYHKKFLPEIVDEDENNFYFKLSKENFDLFKYKLLKIYYHGTK